MGQTAVSAIRDDIVIPLSSPTATVATNSGTVANNWQPKTQHYPLFSNWR